MTFQIKQERFEGPLGLLLELIEKEKLSISEVSLAKVTDEYIAYVKTLEKIDPEQLAEFLVVAAQLMLIKSRSLLPSLKFTGEEEASIEELETRLAEYKKVKDFAARLKELERRELRVLTREAYAGMEVVFYPPKSAAPGILAQTFRAIIESVPKIEKLAEEKLKKIVSLEEKISHLKSLLTEKIERAFSEVVKNSKEKVEVIVSFLALLELARQRFVVLEQKRSFEDITIRKVHG